MEPCLLYTYVCDHPVCTVHVFTRGPPLFIHVASPIRLLTVHQAEGGDHKSQGSSDQQGVRNGREHQTGGLHPAAGVTQALRNGLQEGRNTQSHCPNVTLKRKVQKLLGHA